MVCRICFDFWSRYNIVKQVEPLPLLNLGEQVGEFSQVILELGFRVLCHVVSHAVGVRWTRSTASCLAGCTYSGRFITPLQLAIPQCNHLVR